MCWLLPDFLLHSIEKTLYPLPIQLVVTSDAGQDWHDERHVSKNPQSTFVNHTGRLALPLWAKHDTEMNQWLSKEIKHLRCSTNKIIVSQLIAHNGFCIKVIVIADCTPSIVTVDFDCAFVGVSATSETNLSRVWIISESGAYYNNKSRAYNV